MATISTERRRDLVALLVLFAITFAVAALGGLATAGETGPGTWYAGLRKASFNPPNWAFPVAWNLLYAMMALAAWLVWRSGRPDRRMALRWWAAQLAFNLAWSWIFFASHAAVWALAEMLVLWLLIVTTLRAFWRIDARAGALLLPYLAWVTFAIALNGAIVSMN